MNDWLPKVQCDKMIETHISWVFLCGEFAYKVKKPVDFGFLDFTTLVKRKKFCEWEIVKNSALCGDVYLEVLPVDADGKFGGNGEVADYCVKMKRLPEERKMSYLLEKGEVSEMDVIRIAEILRKYHDELPEYGEVSPLAEFCAQNFEQTEEFVGKALKNTDFVSIKDATIGFLDTHATLLASRIKKDCHGDMYSENVFILEDGSVTIFDALEFNLALSVTDPLLDTAFMAMDLDFYGRADLSVVFVEAYGEVDQKLFDFYKCYRAYVRGKIQCFSGDFKKAGKYFELAKIYASML